MKHVALMLLLVLAVSACSRSEPEVGAGKDAKSATVITEPAALRPMRTLMTAYGTVEFSPSGAQTVAVQYEAIVQRVVAVAGQRIRKGEALLAIAPSAVTRIELDKAQRDLEVAESESARIQRLHGAGLATDGELRAAAASAANARELRDSLTGRAGAGAERFLVAPADGVVDTIAVAAGDVVQPGTQLARIVRPDDVQVRLGIEPAAVGRVAPRQAVTVAPVYAGGMAASGTIRSVDRRVDGMTRMAAALAQVGPVPGLIPGSAVRAEITVEYRDRVIAVSRSAVLFAGESPYLYVVVNDLAQRRDVDTGIRDGDFIEVTHGLKEGEQVVALGNYELADGMKVRLDRVGIGKPSAPRQAGTGAEPDNLSP